jgi:hypothetical protein
MQGVSTVTSSKNVRVQALFLISVAHAAVFLWKVPFLPKEYYSDGINALISPKFSNTLTANSAATATASTSNNDAITDWRNTNKTSSCVFRHYESATRYYDLNRNHRAGNSTLATSFLEKASYIYGERPFVLHGTVGGKICAATNTTVMDGTNPTLVSIQRLATEVRTTILDKYPAATFIASLAFKKNHQCQWPNPSQDGWNRKWPRKVDLLLLDSNLHTLATARIDKSRELDDGRLFIHKGELWLSFKNYEAKRAKLVFFVKIEISTDPVFNPSYSSLRQQYRVCCGRNWAFVQSNNKGFEVLEWPDPVTVSTIRISDISPMNYQHLSPFTGHPQPHDEYTSVFHGTSGSLIPIIFGQQDNREEYLGIGHFRRRSNNNTDDQLLSFAEYGHHYTHAFFTIVREQPENPDSWKMKRVSPEFVLASPHQPEVIQFASGLELVENVVYIGFGKNDCEAAYMTLPLQRVQDLLREVPSEKNQVEVSDLMKTPV